MSAKIKTIGFLMTCAMVCYHCEGFDSANAIGLWDGKINKLIEYFFDQMGIIAMSHFFTVTGYLLFKNYSLKEYPVKMKRRVYSLLIPYILWQAIITGIDILQKQYVFSFANFLSRTFFLVRWPLNGALWYVYVVFLLAIVSPILLLMFKNKRVGWLATIVLIIAVQMRKLVVNPNVLAVFGYCYLENILLYLPFYLVGCYCGKFSDEITSNELLTCILSAIFISFILNDALPGFFSITTIGFMPLMGLYVLPEVPAFLQKKRIYSLSFLIYAIHQPLILDTIPYLRRFIVTIPIPVSVRSILIRVIVLALCVCLATVIHSVLKRIAPKLLGAITGGRFS